MNDRVDVKDLMVELCKRLGVNYPNVTSICLEQGYATCEVRSMVETPDGPWWGGSGRRYAEHTETRKVSA